MSNNAKNFFCESAVCANIERVTHTLSNHIIHNINLVI